MPGKIRQYSDADALQSFAASHTQDSMLTTNKRDFPAKTSSTVRVGVPWQDPMAAREFTAKSVYSDTYFKKVKFKSVCSEMSLCARQHLAKLLHAVKIAVTIIASLRPKPWFMHFTTGDVCVCHAAHFKGV